MQTDKSASTSRTPSTITKTTKFARPLALSTSIGPLTSTRPRAGRPSPTLPSSNTRYTCALYVSFCASVFTLVLFISHMIACHLYVSSRASPCFYAHCDLHDATSPHWLVVNTSTPATSPSCSSSLRPTSCSRPTLCSHLTWYPTSCSRPTLCSRLTSHTASTLCDLLYSLVIQTSHASLSTAII